MAFSSRFLCLLLSADVMMFADALATFGDKEGKAARMREACCAECEKLPPAPIETHSSIEKRPKVTAVLQYFQHKKNIKQISFQLKDNPHIDEIIILEDGSKDDSVAEWAKYLDGRNHAVVRRNNLHEIRSYNFGLKVASGDLVVFLQDDDLMGVDHKWASDAVALFDELPRLGVLSSYGGLNWCPKVEVGAHQIYNPDLTNPFPFVSPKNKIPMAYMMCPYLAPLWVRKKLTEQIGGFDIELSQKPGTPGILLDCDIAARAWKNGWTVAIHGDNFERGVGGHGSMSTPEKKKARDEQNAINYQRYLKMHNVCKLEQLSKIENKKLPLREGHTDCKVCGRKKTEKGPCPANKQVDLCKTSESAVLKAIT